MKIRFSILLLVFCLISAFSVSAQLKAKDNWISVRSKNFLLIGNANEKEIRAVATKLEQFRETFRRLFPRAKFNQTIQTNVVVFKSGAAYRPFKPKRGDGKPDDGIAGYFQPGEDVNYITLSTEGEKEDVFGTIFHEYVHFLLDTNFGRSEVPPWFNEGLAEYYQTFEIKNDQEVYLGNLQDNHLLLLQQNKLIPLKQFFEIDNYSLHQNGNHSRSIFYAQAWALVHYLTQANKGANAANMSKFLNLVMNKVEPEKAFQETFQMDYATMEKALKKYVEQRSFTGSVYTLKEKLVFDNEITVAPLSEADANAYLGDLLYRLREYENADLYLQRSLALDANSSLANTSLGLVRMRQNRFDEAKKYLEKAIASDGRNHLAHYSYAFMLSREDMDEFGYVKNFPAAKAARMRDALQKAIAVNPNFPESYRLLSFISLVNNENLDEALKHLRKGLELEPGNQEYALLAAQIYLRQEKFKEARETAEKLFKTAAEPHLRSNAENLLNSIRQIEDSSASFENFKREAAERGGAPVVVRKKSDKTLTEAEIAKIEEQNKILALNRAVTKPGAGEKQAVGAIEKIVCEKGAITYQIKTDAENLSLTSKDFESLNLNNFLTEDISELRIGCDAQMPNLRAVLTYKENQDPKAKHKGDLVAVEFVPNFFRLKTAEELAAAKQVVIVDDTNESEEAKTREAEFDRQRRDSMMEGIKNALRQPQAGEKREIGSVEKIECGNNSVTFVVNIGGQSLKLKTKSPQDVKMMAFTPEASGLQFNCGVKFPPISTIITYRPNADGKGKTNGEIVALEFVPKSFKL
jgi:tetratricopeptide (TPR) repeat protein